MKILEDQHQKIYNLYYNENHTLKSIAKLYNVGISTINRLFKKNGWKGRTAKEQLHHQSLSGLKEWRKHNSSWCKGLSKADPKMRDAIEKGRQTQIKNGKSKGKNNPMWGRVAVTSIGYRNDIGHMVRSSWEANFARILLRCNIPYEYEKHTFNLSSGCTYTPDFFIPSKNKFYEVKGYSFNDKYLVFKHEYPNIKLVIIDKCKYNRLIQTFSKNIEFEERFTQSSKEHIEKMFVQFLIKLDADRPKMYEFAKSINVSRDFIRNLFGSERALLIKNRELLLGIYHNKLISKCHEFKNTNGHFPSSLKMLQTFYPKSYTLSKFIFGNYKIENLLPLLNV